MARGTLEATPRLLVNLVVRASSIMEVAKKEWEEEASSVSGIKVLKVMISTSDHYSQSVDGETGHCLRN